MRARKLRARPALSAADAEAIAVLRELIAIAGLDRPPARRRRRSGQIRPPVRPVETLPDLAPVRATLRAVLAIVPPADPVAVPAPSIDVPRERLTIGPQRARRCAVCRQPGHNARACLTVEPAAATVDELPRDARIDLNVETAGDCRRLPGPCEYRICRHNLKDTARSNRGEPRTNELGELPDNVPATWCALDIAEDHGATLESTGATFDITRERTRQIELSAMEKIRAALESQGLTADDVRQELDALDARRAGDIEA